MAKVIEVEIKAKTGKSTQNVKDLNKEIKTTSTTAKSTGKGLSGAFTGITTAVQGAIPALASLKTALISTGVGAIVVAMGALVAVFKRAADTGADFQKSLSTLKAVASPTSAELGVLSNQAKELGASTQFTAIQVVKLQTELAKLGFSAADIANSTPAILDLAASLEVDLASAAELAGSTVRSFGLDTEDTQKVVDVMALSTSSSALNFESLRESLKLVAPTSRATGVSIEKTAAMLGVLANNGLKGSVAGTGLSKTFIELNKKGLTLEEGMAKVANSTNKLNTAIDLVGIVGAKSFLSLAESGKEINQLEKDFEGAEGAAKRMAEVRLDNLEGDTTKLSSAFEGFLLSIEDGEGVFNRITRAIIQTTTALLNFITPTKSVTDELQEQRLALFGVEGQLDSFDKIINDTTTSEEDLAKAQRGRLKVINDLQDKYPDFLKNIDSETVSTKELKNAINDVNDSLINKILIQEREEEIQEQAEESADALKNKFEAEEEVLEKVNKLRKKYSDLGIEIKATSPNEVLEELGEIQREQHKLLQENNKENILSVNQIRAITFEKKKLAGTVSRLNKADKEFNEEQEKGNELLKGKAALMKKLGIEEEVFVKKTSEAKIEVIAEESEEEKELRKKAEDELKKHRENLARIIESSKRKAEDLTDITEVQKSERRRERALEELEAVKLSETEKREAKKQINDLYDSLEAEAAIRDAEKKIAQEAADAAADESKRDAKQKITDAEIAAEKKKSEDIIRFRNQTFDNAIKLAGEETKLGKALLVAKQLLLARDFIMSMKAAVKNATVSSTNAVVKGSEASVEVAGSVAKAANTGPPGINLPFILSAIATGIGIIGSVKSAIKSTKKAATAAGGTGGGGGANISAPAAPSGGGASAPPSFNVVGQSGTNQLADAIGGQNERPIRTFVVAGDVTSAQSMERNTISGASLGG